MATTFHLHYAAPFGLQVALVVADEVTPLEWNEGDWWTATLDIPARTAYRYAVVGGGEVQPEHGPARLVPDEPSAVVDRWRSPDPARRSRTSSLFTRSLTNLYTKRPTESGEVTLRLLEPAIRPGWRIVVTGDSVALGEWEPDAGVPLHPAPYPWWEASFATSGTPVDYKYVVIDERGGRRWEVGRNRRILATTGRTVVTDDEVSGLTGWRGAGVAIPVFSLRTERGVGVGQFTDLEPLADWAAAVGLSLVQLLPVNDTVLNHDWDDSYPYNPVSVHALHPLYIDLDAIERGGIEKEVAEARARLNPLPEIDYVTVMEEKWRLLRLAYANASNHLAADRDFAAFVARERHWLVPYSAWCTLRDRHGTPDFRRWEGDATYRADRIERMAQPGSVDYDDLRFHWFVQYHLHRQLTAAAEYARQCGVALKGDLPIGVAPESVEVWQHPELFHIDAQTGAPPDAFAVHGQNWQFPTYDWDTMAADGFQWWRDRFTALARYVDAYRIDHVLGFFRIWEIPQSADDGLLGHFRPSLPLSADEVRAALGDVDLDVLLRPFITVAGLERFGEHAERVRTGFFMERNGGFVLMPGVATQRRILRAFDHGILDDLDEAERAAIARGLLDIAADVLLLEVADGYQPRISWQDTTHYTGLAPHQQTAFDAMAIDFFHHRHSELWEIHGRETLPPIVEATDLLACGEDLGMVPELVPRIMNELGLLSLEIERMPKRLGEWMADPSHAPYLSVVSPSTHDTTTLRMWWTEDTALTARYWQEALGQIGPVPPELDGGTATALMRRQLSSPAMLCILPMSDVFAIDESVRRNEVATERINDPANRHNKWRYRLHLSLEELASADGFNAAVRNLIAASGR